MPTFLPARRRFVQLAADLALRAWCELFASDFMKAHAQARQHRTLRP
ncbi:hypothetical protein RCH14_004656 [Massilia sp. MP_M2]